MTVAQTCTILPQGRSRDRTHPGLVVHIRHVREAGLQKIRRRLLIGEDLIDAVYVVDDIVQAFVINIGPDIIN